MRDLETVKPPKSVAVLLMFLVAFALVPDLFRPPDHPLRGSRAPDIEALRALRGRTVVLGFWTSWSDLGEKQVAVLDDLAKRNSDVAFLALDTVDDPAALERWRASHPTSIPIEFDDDRAARAFQVNNVPMTFVIAPDGKISEVAMGMTESADLARMIRRAH